MPSSYAANNNSYKIINNCDNRINSYLGSVDDGTTLILQIKQRLHPASPLILIEIDSKFITVA
jgi:hypothetical protein